jgi:hypothetical protein
LPGEQDSNHSAEERQAPGSRMPAIKKETRDVRKTVAMAIELQRVGEFHSDYDRQQPRDSSAQ